MMMWLALLLRIAFVIHAYCIGAKISRGLSYALLVFFFGAILGWIIILLFVKPKPVSPDESTLDEDLDVLDPEAYARQQEALRKENSNVT